MLSACVFAKDETLTGYAERGAVYQLVELDNSSVNSAITLEIVKAKTLAGRAPCNRYNTTINAPMPWFEIGPISATKRACPDLAIEQKYFNLLSQARFAEIHQGQIILSNDQGVLLVFERSAHAE